MTHRHFQDELDALKAKLAEMAGLAEEAAKQWTGTFNPRPFDAAGALELYQLAY